MRKKYNRGKGKLFPGTDKAAFKKGAKGKTPAERSRIYHREKLKNERKELVQAAFGVGASTGNHRPKIKSTPTKRKVQTPKSKKTYRYKKTIIDGLRDYRSSEIVSNVSNALAIFIVKTTGRRLDNKEKNILRSTIAFVSSEVFNKIFEEELEVIETIKLFIKIGKTIYKIGAWLDEQDNSVKVNDKEIKCVSALSLEYRAFLRKYPTISSYYKEMANCLSKQEVLSGKKCEKRLILQRKGVEQNDVQIAPNFCEYYNYCHGIQNGEKEE